MSTQPFPLDFESLEKGQIIETSTLVEVLGCEPGDKAWSLALMGLVDQIYDHRRDLVARVDHDRIIIETDAGACDYLDRRFHHHNRGMIRTALRRGRIGGDLTPEQQAMRECRDRITSATVLAAQQALRKQRKLERIGFIRREQIEDGED